MEEKNNGKQVSKIGNVFIFENVSKAGKTYYTMSKRNYNGGFDKFFLTESEYLELRSTP